MRNTLMQRRNKHNNNNNNFKTHESKLLFRIDKRKVQIFRNNNNNKNLIQFLFTYVQT